MSGRAVDSIKSAEDLVTNGFIGSLQKARTTVFWSSEPGVAGAGARITGPAIIEEQTTTVVVQPGWSTRLEASGSYVLTRDAT